jgi:hypothetical protein
MLKARLYELELQKQQEKVDAANAKKTDIGWGHQIRSYVLQPYQLIKDLRTGHTSTNPGDVLDGEAGRIHPGLARPQGLWRGCGSRGGHRVKQEKARVAGPFFNGTRADCSFSPGSGPSSGSGYLS